MSTPWIILATIAFYFLLLFVISWITGRKADNAGFFTGNRKSPWYLVAIAMIGAPISGVTFISVPGAVAANVVGRDGKSEWGPEGDVDFSSAWFNLIGCGFLVRREVLVQTGGFDEDFGLYYNDLEFALRILAFGLRKADRPSAQRL